MRDIVVCQVVPLSPRILRSRLFERYDTLGDVEWQFVGTVPGISLVNLINQR